MFRRDGALNYLRMDLMQLDKPIEPMEYTPGPAGFESLIYSIETQTGRRIDRRAIALWEALLEGKRLVISSLVEPRPGYASVVTLTELSARGARDLMARIEHDSQGKLRMVKEQIKSTGHPSHVWYLEGQPK